MILAPMKYHYGTEMRQCYFNVIRDDNSVHICIVDNNNKVIIGYFLISISANKNGSFLYDGVGYDKYYHIDGVGGIDRLIIDGVDEV